MTKTKRKTVAKEASEDDIQISLVEHIEWFGRLNMMYFHPPNGGSRAKSEGARFKAMGVVPGVPDLIFFVPKGNSTKVYGLELKTTKGKQSKAQKEACNDMEDVGATYAVAYGFDDAIALLTSWGLIDTKPTGRGRRKAERRARELDPGYVE